jgi:hypothetical protein
MGTPIPPDDPPPPEPEGFLCNVCWGVGKPFGPETPDRVLLRLSGVIKGPTWGVLDGDPENGDYYCDQQGVGFPCLFTYTVGAATASISWDIAGTFVAVFNSNGIQTFAHVIVGQCATSIDNELNAAFTDGSVKIYIPDVIK